MRALNYVVPILLIVHLNSSSVIAQTPPRVELENTEVISIKSEVSGVDYQLSIALPATYAQSDAIYPVIYLLDPYRLFPMIWNIVDVYTFPYDILPETIIVGIGYGGEGPEAALNWVQGRTRDLTPTIDTAAEQYFERQITAMGFLPIEIESGGAAAFHRALRDEIIPFVESRYRTDSQNRMLVGHSYGGLFGLFVLFTEPELFDNYLVSSPSMHYKDKVIFNYESAYAKDTEDLPAKVFISCGDEEEIIDAEIERLETILLSHKYPGLQIHTAVIPDAGHVTCVPIAMTKGLEHLLGND